MLPVKAEDDVDVTSGKAILVRRRALAGVVAVGPLPVVIDRIAVLVDAPDISVLDIILFVVREVRTVDHDHPQVRAGGRHALRGQAVVLVIDLVALIAGDHRLSFAGVCDEVPQDIAVSQRRFVCLHAIDPHVTVIRPDGDGGRRVLVQPVGRVVDQGPCSYAVLIGHDIGRGIGVFRIQGVDVVLILDDILFAVRGVQLICGRLDIGRMCLHVQPDLDLVGGGDALEPGRSVVPDIRDFKNHLELSAGLDRIRPEQVIADVCPAACLDAEVLVVITVYLISARDPVEVAADGHGDRRVVFVGPQPVHISIRPAGGLEVESQVSRDGRYIIAQLYDIDPDLYTCDAACDCQGVDADIR